MLYIVQKLSGKIKYVPKIDWNLKLTWLWYKCEGFFFQHYYFLSFNSKRHFISEVVGTKNKIGILKYSYWKRIRSKHFWYLEAEKSDNTKMDIPLFRNKRFALNEMFQRTASKFPIFYVKENSRSFFVFHFVQLYFSS